MSTFRMQGKKFFLTFPQNVTAKEDALANIKEHLPEYEWVMIAQETHQDGEKHLHVGIEFKDKIHTRNSGYFDCVAGKHGDYKTMKSVAGTLKYLRKEDKDPLVDGNVPADSGGRKNKGAIVCAMLDAGSTSREIYAMEPSYFLIHKRKIEELAGWLAIKKLRESLEPFPGRFVYEGTHLETGSIVQWMNDNLKRDAQRPIKTPQLYVHGPANSRKTSLVTFLEKWFRVYWVPKDEAFYDFYDDDDYDVIVFDEFKMQKSLQWINSFIEGAPCLVRKKGVAGTMKRKNLPVIFLSNYSVISLLPDADDRVLFESRIQQVSLTSPIDVDQLQVEAITLPNSPEPEDLEIFNLAFPPKLDHLYCDEDLSGL